MKNIFLLLAFLLCLTLQAQVKPAHIFDNNMVLQREKPVKVWGLAAPKEKVTVEFGGQVKYAVANQLGEWYVYLDPMGANAQQQEMKVSGKESSVLFNNVLVGDVWILGGQSNMEFDLFRIFHGDVEVLSANFPKIRLMTIPCSANLKPQKDFDRINEYDSWYERADKKRIEVMNSLTVDPVEVGYAWARNPMGNLVDEDYPVIPVPLFRSDKWDYPEAPYLPDEYTAHRTNLKMLRKQASEMAGVRLIREAEMILKNIN